MWRSSQERAESGRQRLLLAAEVWEWRPHARQAAFFGSAAQVRVAACGRRWGKTECLSLDVASLALTEVGCRQLIVAPTDVQARLLGGEVLRRLLGAFESGHPALEGKSLTVRQRPSLTVTIGTYPRAARDPSLLGKGEEGKAAGDTESVIWCRSAGRDGRSLRGLWAHRIVVDEAGAVPDTVLTDVLLPMLIDVGGEYVLASSPMGRRSAYYRLFVKGSQTYPRSQMTDPSLSGKGEEGRPPRPNNGEPEKAAAAVSPIGDKVVGDTDAVTFESFRCPTSDNPHLDHAFLLAQRDELGEAAARQELDAEFVDDFGAVFREEDIQAALREDTRVELVGRDLVSEPIGDKIYTVGIDWGRKLDFTVVCVLECGEETYPRASRDPSLLGKGEEGGQKEGATTAARVVGLWRWQGVGWDAQVAAVAGVLARFRPWRVLADGNSIGDPLVDALNKAPRIMSDDGGGRPVERFLFTADSKAALVDRLALGLASRGVSFPYHRALVQELYGFEYGKAGPSGRARTGARPGGHDDCVMALALAWWAAPEGAPEAPASRLLLGSSVGLSRREA